jgi:hypothetical protein
MENFVFGILAIAGGAVFCFRGALAFRILIPIWGAFVGFAAGAGFMASMTGDGFLQTGLAWTVGLVTAAIFFVLAYLYYAVAVVITMASVGFALGSSLMVALNITWSWIIILAGVVLGVVLALSAIIANLPLMLLMVLGAIGGASAMVMGFMLLFGVVNAADFTNPAATITINDQWWWYVLYLVLVVLGILVQVRAIGHLRQSMQEAWLAGRGTV